jgi:hypothetical protein
MTQEKKTTLSEIEATALRSKLTAAMIAHTKANLAVAELLFEACYGYVRRGNEDVPLPLAWGHDDFDEYAEHELGLHQTTARGLVTLYEELYVRRSFTEGMLPASITKLRLLAKVSKRVKDGASMNRWVGKARELSCCEFEEAVENEFGNDRKFRPLGFRLKLSKYTGFMRKMRSAREELHVQSNGEALSIVMDEWYERHHAKEGVRAKRSA